MSDIKKGINKRHKITALMFILFFITGLSLALMYSQIREKIITKNIREIHTLIKVETTTLEKITTQNQTIGGTLWDVVFTIIGGLVAGFAGLLIEGWRKEIEIRDKHFQDIKHNCLEPILKQLSELREYYEFRESKYLSLSHIEDLLKSDIHWWEYFSFKDGPNKANALLYDDLLNHYIELSQKLDAVQKSFKTDYPKFLQAICNLLRLIEEDTEFQEFKKEYERPVISEESFYPYKAVFFLSLKIDKSNWPNIYSYFKPKLDKLMELGNKFYSTKEAERVRSMRIDMLNKIDLCIERIKEILLSSKLKGKCRYLK